MSMSHGFMSALRRALLLVGAFVVADPVLALSDPARVLQDKYASLGEQLQHNPFQRPLVLDSTETSDRVGGDIYAVLDTDFSVVRLGLSSPQHWCELMLLHSNTKYCYAAQRPSGTTLKVNIGKKTPQDLADVARLEFNFRVEASTPRYLEVVLAAPTAPMGTRDTLIRLEAVALPKGGTFLHLTYAYTTTLMGRLAMRAYLATAGAGKVGFSVVGARADGAPDFIAGVRGMVERNTVRYYLAIESYLEFADAAPQSRFEQRLQSWFSAVELYPRQLHEMERAEYAAMKRSEYLRQQIDQ